MLFLKQPDRCLRAKGKPSWVVRGKHLVAICSSRGFSNKASQPVSMQSKEETYLMNSLSAGRKWRICTVLKYTEGIVCMGKECFRMKRFQTPSKLQTFPLAPSHTVATFGQCLVSRGMGWSFSVFFFLVWQQRSFVSALLRWNISPSEQQAPMLH